MILVLFSSLFLFFTLNISICEGSQTAEGTVFSSFDYSDFYEEQTEAEELSSFDLSFFPDRLNFNDSPLCIASVSEFTIVNSGKVSVEILSISSSDSQFHPLFFRKELLHPNTSLSVQAFFLPYFEQPFKSTFFINNSLGDQLIYSVEGKGVPNPFRVKPFLSNRALVGSSFPFYPITLFNPYKEPLQILEVFTSESFLSLNEIEFSSASSNSSNHDAFFFSPSSSTVSSNMSSSSLSRLTWVIEPFTSRDIISIAIVTKMLAGFYRGFIHIHTNKEKMIIPVEIELLSGGLSLYPPGSRIGENSLLPPRESSQQLIDFGLFTRRNEKISVDLAFWNYGLHSIHVLSVTSLQDDSRLTIDFDSIVVPSAVSSSSYGPTKVATLSFTAKSFDRIDGRLFITTNDSNAALAVFEVHYSGTFLQGRLTVSASNTTIFLSPSLLMTDNNDLSRLLSSSSLKKSRKQDSPNRNIISRSVIFTNGYNTPVAIRSSVAASCSDFIRVNSSLLDSSIAESFHTFLPLFLEIDISQFKGNKAKEVVFPKTCWLEIITNVSSQRFPIHFITGQLKVELFEGGEGSTNEDILNASRYEERWDYYLASLNYYFPRDLRMILSNDNPVSIPIKLRNASCDVCVCREVSWSKGQYDIRRGIDFMKNSTALTYEAAQSLSNKCACYFQSASGLRTSTKSQADIVIKPGYNLLVSIHYHFTRNSTGDPRVSSISSVDILPASLSSLVSSSSSLRYQFLSHLLFTTSYQFIHLNFHHNFAYDAEGLSQLSPTSPSSIASTFFTLLPSSRSSFVLGFEHSLNYALPPSIMQNIESIKMKPFLSFLTMNLYSSQNIIQIQSTYLRCLHGSDVVYANSHSYSEDEGGEDDYIFGFRLWICFSTVLKELRYLDSPIPEIIDIFDYYEEFKKEANKFTAMSEVYFKFLQLQRLVFRYFPYGIELLRSSRVTDPLRSSHNNDKSSDYGSSSVSLILRTADVLQSHGLDLLSIQLPLSVLSSSYSLSYVVSTSYLSAFSVGDGGAFFAIYIQVSNPFDFDIDFMLIDESDFLSKSNPKILLSDNDKGCPGQDQFVDLQERNFSLSSVDSAKLSRLSSSVDLQNTSNHHHILYNYTRTLIHSTAIIRSYHNYNIQYGKEDGFTSKNFDTDIPISSSCFPPLKPSTVNNIGAQTSLLTARLKNVIWKVKAGKRGFIGPIDFSLPPQDVPSVTSFSVSKTFYVGNSFSGYNSIHIAINISEPELETRNISVCHPKDFCSSLAFASSRLSGFLPVLPVSINVTSFQDVLSIDLFSKRSSITVSDAVINNNSCVEYESKLKGARRLRDEETLSFCRQFPLRLQPDELVAFTLPVVVDCSRRRSSVTVQFFEFPSSNTPLHQVQWIQNYSDIVLAQCLRRTSTFLLCFLTFYLSIFIGLSYLLLDSSIDLFFGIRSTPSTIRENQTYISPFERKLLSSPASFPYSSSMIYQEVDLEDVKLVTNLTVDELLETLTEANYNVSQPSDNDTLNRIKLSPPQHFWKHDLADLEKPTTSSSNLGLTVEVSGKPSDEHASSDDEEISQYNDVRTHSTKPEETYHSSSARGQSWDIVIDGNPAVDDVPACFQPLDLDHNLRKPPSLVTSIGAPPGLGFAASSSTTYHIENHSFSRTLQSPQTSRDGTPWWYRPLNAEKGYTLFNEFQPDNKLINYNNSITNISRTPSNSNTDEVDEQNIFRLSENINELLDEKDEELEISHPHPGSLEIGNIDPWQQMNNPNISFFGVISPRETKKKSNLFFGPGGFFDEIPSRLEGSLEDADPAEIH
jgi:hypothetical protein